MNADTHKSQWEILRQELFSSMAPSTEALEVRPWSARDASVIPPRQWLYGYSLLRAFISVLVAPGGVGKTAYSIAVGLSVATGRGLIGEYVHAQGNVLFANLEDPEDEFDRRVAAAVIQHEIDPTDLEGRLFQIDGRKRRLLIAANNGDGLTIAYPDKAGLEAEIRRLNISLVVVDPFVNSHSLDENDNEQINAVARAWAEIANSTGCAILLVHHTRKGAIAGDMESARGASALIAAARVGMTLTAMTQDEAEKFDISPTERRRYVRIDDGKANLSPPSEAARWFALASIGLNNGTPDYPYGDNVQALTRWAPPGLMAGHSNAQLNAVLDRIEEGYGPGILFGASSRGQSENWVGHLIVEMLGIHPNAAKSIIAVWMKNGLLVEEEFHHPEQRRPRKGLRVDNSKRPAA